MASPRASLRWITALPFKFWRGLALFLIIMIPLLVYRATASPSIGWIDSGVIATAAATLGIANPPGFPSYMVIAHLFTKLPWGTVVDQLALLSQLSGVGCLILVWFLARRLLRERPHQELAAVICTLAVAFSYSFWSQSINVETYTLTNLAILALLSLGVWLDEKVEVWVAAQAEQRARQKKNMHTASAVAFTRQFALPFVAVALLLGIASGLNPIAAAIVPALGWWAWRRRELVKQHWQLFAAAALLSAVTFLAVYAYLPIRAAAHPYLNWGSPTTLPLIWKHLTGGGLDIYEPETNSINGFTGQPVVWWGSFWHFLHLGVLQFTPLLVPLILWGWWRARQLQPRIWSLQMAVVGFNLLFIVLYYGGNQESWMITSWLVAGTWLGVGVSEALTWALQYRPQFRWPVLAAAAATPLLLLLFWWPMLNRHDHKFADDYAQNLLRDLPPNAVLVGGGDFWNSLTAYEHEVLRKRPDVTYITYNMFYIFPWYRENLHHHTSLKITSELEAMTEPVTVEGPTKVLEQLVADNPDRQFFITPLLLRDSIVAGTNKGVYTPTKYNLIPSGLLLQLIPASNAASALPQAERSAFEFHPQDALAKTPFYLERNYTGAFKILLDEYAEAFSGLAKWQANHGQVPSAEKTFLKGIQVTGSRVTSLIHYTAVFYAQQDKLKAAQPYFEQSFSLDSNNPTIRQNYQTFLSQLASASAEVASSAPNPNPSTQQKHLSPNGLRFLLPVGWQVDDKGKGNDAVVTLQSPQLEGNKEPPITVVMKRHPAIADDHWQAFLADQPSMGLLVNSGTAKFPNVHQAFLKVWLPMKELIDNADETGQVDPKKAKNVFQFFLQKDAAVIEVTVTPPASSLMKMFDQIMTSLEIVGK